MDLGTIFSEKEYKQGYEFANSNGYTIKEVESRQEWQEKEIEIINDEGETEIKKEKELVLVRYFQIVEIPIYTPTNEDISQMRQSAYIERTDPLTLRKLRKLALGEWTSEEEKDYIYQMQKISEEINKEFTYIVDNNDSIVENTDNTLIFEDAK